MTTTASSKSILIFPIFPGGPSSSTTAACVPITESAWSGKEIALGFKPRAERLYKEANAGEPPFRKKTPSVEELRSKGEAYF